jgi:mono/diheme cytochrome c family protein
VRSSLQAVTLLLAFAALAGAFQVTIKKVPAQDTSPTSGKEMFAQYCAACHGTDGKGEGPAAAALKTKPADLTQLASHNNGKFPGERVSLYIEGADTIAAHGSREMPVWGKVLKGLSANESVASLRVANLTAYVKTLQVR